MSTDRDIRKENLVEYKQEFGWKNTDIQGEIWQYRIRMVFNYTHEDPEISYQKDSI